MQSGQKHFTTFCMSGAQATPSIIYIFDSIPAAVLGMAGILLSFSLLGSLPA